MNDQNMPCGHKWSDYVSCAIGDEAYMCGKCSPIGMRVAQLEAENDKLHEWISAVCESATAAEMWAYVHRYSPGD